MTKHIYFPLSFSLFLITFTSLAYAESEAMQSMPVISPKRTFVIKDSDHGEELQSQRGYGDDEPMVRMMNLMMVEGSGMEGMDMNEMNTKAGSEKSNSHSAHSTMLAASERTKSDPMSQMGSGPAYELKMETPPSPPQVGANLIQFTISSQADKKPVRGLKLKSQVYMTSMDMGTEEPKVKETSPGKYQLKAVFSMQGPWAVKIMFPDGSSQVLEFNANRTSKN